jgi:hypothetical protein
VTQENLPARRAKDKGSAGISHSKPPSPPKGNIILDGINGIYRISLILTILFIMSKKFSLVLLRGFVPSCENKSNFRVIHPPPRSGKTEQQPPSVQPLQRLKRKITSRSAKRVGV